MSDVTVTTESATPAPVTIVPAEKPTVEATLGEIYDKIHKPRTEGGKFAAKESKNETVEQPNKTAAPDTETAQEPDKAAVKPEKPVIDMPKSWSADRTSIWQSLSPEAQEIVAQREGEAQKRLSELGETAKAAEPLRQIVDRYKSSIGNRSPEQALEALFQAEERLRSSPDEAILWLAQAYNAQGVLSQLAPRPPGDTSQGTDNNSSLLAVTAPLQRQVHELRSELQT